MSKSKAFSLETVPDWGVQFTNFANHPTEPNVYVKSFPVDVVWLANSISRRVSTPRTKYTENPIDTVPLYGLSRMKQVITQAFPELAEFEFTDSRV